MDVGIDSFAALMPDPRTGQVPTSVDRMGQLIREIEAADRAGLDAFGIGEHHRAEFVDSAPTMILAAAAVRTKSIRLHSAVTVLSAVDPVRLFQEFATLDLLSRGRAEIVVGRGSFVDAFPLFGLELEHYDALFFEKLGLLLELRDRTFVNWAGRFRPALTNQPVYPRPYQERLPVWVGVGGTPESFARAGRLGLPLMVAIIGGSFARFRPLVELYREAGRRAGHPAERLRVGLHAMGFVAATTGEAKDAFFPGWHRMFTSASAERGWPPPTRPQFEALCGPGGAYLIGDPETVSCKILEANEILGGLARVNLQMSAAAGDHEAMLSAIELLGTQVVPKLRARHAEPTPAIQPSIGCAHR